MKIAIAPTAAQEWTVKTMAKQTPLEMAREKENTKPCRQCDNAERIGNTLYCKSSGKIIMPMFYDVCCCRGNRGKQNAD